MRMNRTGSTAISKSVKTAVAERDGGLCVICKRVGFPNAHYINRAQGGLGIEENIVSLCSECHRAYDGRDRGMLGALIREYLMSKYRDWDERKLVYHKWEEELRQGRERRWVMF
jgi:hypothetical protein